jgi:hypothetical protein
MRKFTNNASSLLASGIDDNDGQLTIGAGEASLFPSPTGGDYAVCTLEDVSGNLEIVHMTARAGTLCTITRAQEGTTAIAFASGSRFELRCTAAVMTAMLQKDGDTITGEIAMTGAGRISGGGLDDSEVVNSPMRGDPGVSTNEFAVPPGGGPPTISGFDVFHEGNLTRSVVAAIMFPTGAVIMWYGTVPNIPAGWALCNGTGGTPDLRDKFVVGAGTTYALGATGGAVSGTTSSDGTGVTGSTVLTVGQLPAHTHTMATQLFVDEIDAGVGKTYVVDGTGMSTGSAGSNEGHTHTGPAHTHTVPTLPPYFGLYFIMKT